MLLITTHLASQRYFRNSKHQRCCWLAGAIIHVGLREAWVPVTHPQRRTSTLHINHGFLLQDQSLAPTELCGVLVGFFGGRETKSKIFLLNERLTKRKNIKYPQKDQLQEGGEHSSPNLAL